MNGDWPSWLAAWLATYALHSTLLILVAWILTRLPALRSPRTAEVVWRTALFGGVLTACLHVLLGAPLWRAPIVERAAAAAPPLVVEIPVVAVEAAPTLASPVADTVAVSVPAVETEGAAPLQPPSPAWLLLLWPLGVMALIWRGHRTRGRLVDALRGRRDLTDEHLRTLVRRLARDAGVARPVRLTAAWPLASPVALGARHLEICLPERAVATLSTYHLEAMLAHEMAHLTRHDPQWLRAYRGITALLFFQPLNHLAVARLRDASEMLCDAWAADSQPRRVALAECLTIVADWIVEGRQPQAAPAMARKASQLGHRVHALLDPAGPCASPGRARLGLLALAPLLLVMALAPGLHAVAAPATPQPTLTEPDEAFDPVTALQDELALLATEVAELTALLGETNRPDLALRVEAHLATLEARRDALLQALVAGGR